MSFDKHQSASEWPNDASKYNIPSLRSVDTNMRISILHERKINEPDKFPVKHGNIRT